MKDRLVNLIKDGFFHIIGGSILTKLIGFISNIFVIRLVSKAAYGCFTYADNLYSYVVVLTGLGMATALIIRCGEKNSLDNKNAAYFRYSILRGGTIQILGSIIVISYFFFFTEEFRDATIFVIALFFYPLLVFISQCCSCFVRAYQQNKLYSNSAVVQSLTLAVCSIALAAICDALGIIFARYIALFALILMCFTFIRKVYCKGQATLSKQEKRDYSSLAFSLLLANIFSDLMFSNEMLLVNQIVSNEIVTAEYRIATLLPMQILFVTQSLMVYFLPKFVRLKAERKNLWKYSAKVGILNFSIITLICAVAIIITPWLIEFLYGDLYSNCASMSRIFWIAYGLNAALRIVPVNVLAATGFEKINSRVSILGCVVHFVIAWVVLTYLGVRWLALALIGAYLLIGAISWRVLYKVCVKECGSE